jgi:phenylalanyl-tRNA synthetase alpha chain
MDGIDTLKARYLAAVAGAADEAGLEEVRVGGPGQEGRDFGADGGSGQDGARGSARRRGRA